MDYELKLFAAWAVFAVVVLAMYLVALSRVKDE